MFYILGVIGYVLLAMIAIGAIGQVIEFIIKKLISASEYWWIPALVLIPAGVYGWSVIIVLSFLTTITMMLARHASNK